MRGIPSPLRPNRILCSCFFLLATSAALSAQAQVPIMRVEEDWELFVTEPDEQLDAPQIVMVAKPYGDADNLQLQVDLNHASFPDYSTGGIQLRASRGDTDIAGVRLQEDVRLRFASETITWTQIIERQSGGIAFGIAGGSSTSWGNFGDATTYLTVSSGDEEFQYSPDDSLRLSGTTYAGNRVRNLTLKRVRYVDLLGQVTEVSIDRSTQ